MVKQRSKKRPRVDHESNRGNDRHVVNDDDNNDNNRSRGVSGGWRKVNVGFGKEMTNSDDDIIIDTTTVTKNHYDDTKLARRATQDLEADPTEHPGVFMGLEVLDGNQYTIIPDPTTGTKKFFIKPPPKTNNVTSVVVKKHQKKKTKHNNCDIDDNENKDVVDGQEKQQGTQNENEGTVSPAKAKKKSQKKKHKKKIKNGKKNNETRFNNGGGTVVAVSRNDDTPGSHMQQEEKQNESLDDDTDDELVNRIQTNWMSVTGGVEFHKIIYKSLIRNNWYTPTPIQAAVLPAAILGRRNIVGAAPTGSGKTLAFLLPIYQYLIEQEEEEEENHKQEENDGQQQQQKQQQHRTSLQGLILTPTRELALQIHAEAQKLIPGKIGTLVGGLSIAKQQRVLEKNRPAVITATPGRLWELISSREHDHLNDLSQIRFLVIDEADRMIQQGSFPQLAQILDAVQNANPNMDDDDSDSESGEENSDNDDDNDRMLGLPGIRGEAKVTMLNDDILKRIEEARQDSGDYETIPEMHDGTDNGSDSNSETEEVVQDENEMSVGDEGPVSLPVRPPVHRQTFVYSATLTLPASTSFSKTNNKALNKGKNKNKNVSQTPEGAIAEILAKARARGVTKIVDLTNAAASRRETISSTLNEVSTIKNIKDHEKLETTHKAKQATSTTTKDIVASKLRFRLPDGLKLHVIKCTQRHKDSHLYAYLMTTVAGSSGPALIFCNSIAGVRRVGAILQTLGLPVRILHAQMQQRARFKAVESLNRDKSSRTIVVATDVAARGLDIPTVSSVVHYDAARTMDTFIHRSGRTARGVGEGAVGSSLSLVSPDEDRFHAKIVQSLHVTFEGLHMDGRLFNAAQERVNLASKVAIAEDKVSKVKRQNQWFREKAEEAGLEIDDHCIEEGLVGGGDNNNRDASLLREAENAKVRLKGLLSQPLQTQKFGKFLSTNSALSHEVSSQFLVPSSGPRAKKTKKRRR